MNETQLHSRLGTISAADREWSICILKKLVEINSSSHNETGLSAVCTLLKNTLENFGLTVLTINLKKGIALTASSGHGSNHILCVGHYDTVHQENSAFSKFIVDGDTARGPGVLDMKGGITVLLSALRILSEQKVLLDLPLTVFLNPDEEIGTIYSKNALLQTAKSARSALVFEWGREQEAVILRRKGIAVLDISAKGRQAHSGNAHQDGANAIVALASFLTKACRITDYAAGVTLNVGKVEGGTSPTIVPDFAHAVVDVRFPETTLYTNVLIKLRTYAAESAQEVAGTTIEIIENSVRPPMAGSDASKDLFARFSEAGRILNIKSSVFPGIIGGGSDANYLSEAGIPTLDGMGPCGQGAHTNDEQINLPTFWRRVSQLALFLYREGVK